MKISSGSERLGMERSEEASWDGEAAAVAAEAGVSKERRNSSTVIAGLAACARAVDAKVIRTRAMTITLRANAIA